MSNTYNEFIGSGQAISFIDFFPQFRQIFIEIISIHLSIFFKIHILVLIDWWDFIFIVVLKVFSIGKSCQNKTKKNSLGWKIEKLFTLIHHKYLREEQKGHSELISIHSPSKGTVLWMTWLEQGDHEITCLKSL